MNNLIITPKRLIWIDWAKALAITLVVFGHIPENPGSFLVCYITQFHMPLFFFISGFLTKKEYISKETLKKYWQTLIIPYICFNILFYPYWIARHYIETGSLAWFDYCKPLIGTIMLQHKTIYYESLNGVTWFISALFIMRLLCAIANKYKHGYLFIFSLFILTTLFYLINEYERFITDLPFVGFIRCYPFFIIGQLSRKRQYFRDIPKKKKDTILALVCLTISILTYFIGHNDDIFSYALFFWTINLSAIYGILSFCKLLNSNDLIVIRNISIGTIVIMGMHWMLIGGTNYFLEKILKIENISYSWFTAILLSLLFIAIIYPVIILFAKKYPFMIGKKIS